MSFEIINVKEHMMRSAGNTSASHLPGASRVPDGGGPVLLAQACTLGVCIGALIIGIWGLWLPYPREHVPPDDLPALVAQTISADLPPPPPAPALPPPPAPDAAPPLPDNTDPEPPAPPEVIAPPEAPPLVEVATPGPPAFAVPVEGPVKLVDPKLAALRTPAQPAPAQRAVQGLTFGIGEGRQPNPVYPQESADRGEQGTVSVRFTVGEDGSVVAAELSSSCRFVRLNQSALRTIRNSWRFAAGPVRNFEVSIIFKAQE